MSSTSNKSAFGQALTWRRAVLISVPSFVLIYYLAIIYFHSGIVPRVFQVGDDLENIFATCVFGAVLFCIHGFILWSVSAGVTTRLRRALNSLLLIVLGVMGLVVLASGLTGGLPVYELAPLYGLGFFVVIIVRGLVSFSMSSSPLGLVPLFLLYLIVFGVGSLTAFVLGHSWFRFLGIFGLGIPFMAVPLFALAVYLFPMHRRVAEEWRPKRLPRLPKVRRAGRTRAGLTLIELLIVVAIIAIFVPAVARLSGQAHMTLERQSTRRASIEYVRDEVALLRALETLPEPGVHAPSEELMEEYPFMTKSEFEIRAGPVEGVAEVEFRIRLIYEFDDIERSYFVLIGDPEL